MLNMHTEGKNMPNTNWSRLNTLQLGRYAEYFSKMEFVSYGFEVYTSEVDDHGIDFVAKTANGRFLEIQVKSLRWGQSNYVFMQKEKWDINNPNLYLVLIIFTDTQLPTTYLIPSTAWQMPSALFTDKDYTGLKSKPEYGLNLSMKNMPLLEPFRIESMVTSIR